MDSWRRSAFFVMLGLMRVTIYRTVRNAPTDRWVHLVLKAAGRGVQNQLKRGAQYAILFVGERRIAALNAHYRGVHAPTDVLTFSDAHDNSAEIVLCPAVIVRQAGRFGVRAREELARSLVHGVLHAQGFDHVSTAGAQEMFAFQEKIVVSAMRLLYGKKKTS